MPNPLDDTIERLCTEFESTVDPTMVVEVVYECCDELDMSPEFARTEMVEPLARERLADLSVYRFAGEVDHGSAAGSWVRIVVHW
jgi:hypothetical protein